MGAVGLGMHPQQQLIADGDGVLRRRNSACQTHVGQGRPRSHVVAPPELDSCRVVLYNALSRHPRAFRRRGRVGSLCARSPHIQLCVGWVDPILNAQLADSAGTPIVSGWALGKTAAETMV